MLGDCLERMKEIPDGSVDMILADLPYGIKEKRTRMSEWDKPIPLDSLWHHYKRVAKRNAAIVLTASQPFTTDLISSNRKDFRYTLVWDKTKGGGFANANRQPMKSHEDVVVFYAAQPTYVPQMRPREKSRKRVAGLTGSTPSDVFRIRPNANPELGNYDFYFPTSIIVASTASRKDHFHPTQKPLSLIEWLIKTYSLEKETILDNCFGSGTTGVACVRNGRKFIGIESDERYFDLGKQRIQKSISDNGGFYTDSHIAQESLINAR